MEKAWGVWEEVRTRGQGLGILLLGVWQKSGR